MAPRDFDSIAAQLAPSKDVSLSRRQRLLETLCPEIKDQILRDRGRTGPFQFWGLCSNHDEFANQTIVADEIVELISSLAEFDASPQTPHAGLQHTYGYLFSTIETPFGRKRDRWINEDLEAAFGQPSGTFGPAPEEGTLLSNVTWLAGQIAFRNDARLGWLRRALRSRVAASLLNLDLSEVPIQRMTETFRGRFGGTRTQSTIVLRTDLVPLPAVNTWYQGPPWLLVYSIHDRREPHPQLVTLFTVSEQMRTEMEARCQEHTRTDIRLRYNAVIHGVSHDHYRGECRLQ